MKIGTLSARTGVPTRMLRYYEDQGLLAPQRSGNGYRAFAEDDVDRVTMVRDLIRSGLPTRLIRIVLEMENPVASGWTERCTRDFAEVLAGELEALDARIACLTRSRDTVRDYLSHTEHAALLSGSAGR
jgi:DNA-binding transcriptional MerR regulator